MYWERLFKQHNPVQIRQCDRSEAATSLLMHSDHRHGGARTHTHTPTHPHTHRRTLMYTQYISDEWFTSTNSESLTVLLLTLIYMCPANNGEGKKKTHTVISGPTSDSPASGTNVPRWPSRPTAGCWVRGRRRTPCGSQKCPGFCRRWSLPAGWSGRAARLWLWLSEDAWAG